MREGKLDLQGFESERLFNPDAGLATVLRAQKGRFVFNNFVVLEVDLAGGKISCNMELKVVRMRNLFSAMMSRIETLHFLTQWTIKCGICRSFFRLLSCTLCMLYLQKIMHQNL